MKTFAFIFLAWARLKEILHLAEMPSIPTATTSFPTLAPNISSAPTASPITLSRVTNLPITRKVDILDFTPHLDGDEPHSILPDHIVRDRIDLVANYTNGIRVFACYNGAEAIRYAKSLGLYTVAGAWVDTKVSDSEAEIRCIIDLAIGGHVDLASVGSEAIMWYGLTATDIVSYVEMFRSAVPNIPVTTALKYEELIVPDNWEIIVPAVDLLYVNYYPFWSGQHIDFALATSQREHEDMKAIAGGKKVWISEAGWPSDGACWNGLAAPTPENQERYFREMLNWTASEGIVLSWFQGFEEPWKNGNEWCSVAGQWGIFDAYGNIKPGPAHVLHDVGELVN